MYIDTHAHLNFEPFIRDPQPYIDRALQAGVTKMIVPAADLASSEKAIELAERYDGVFAAVGVHPQDAAAVPDNYISLLASMLDHPKVCAVGEVGLDYYRRYAPRDVQMRVFREQAELARSLGYPLIIHNREADDDTFSLLEDLAYFNVQFHCFGGDAAYARNVIERGALVSFTGVITFSQKAREIARTLPPEKLMIETDCPWMAPVPYRGKPNEPAYVVEVAAAFADIFGRSVEDIAALTTATAERFFRLSQT